MMKRILIGLVAGALGFACASAPRAAVETQRGPHEWSTTKFVWTDDSRGREIPLRVYLPRKPERFPVVIFSHGLANDADGYRYLGEHWASHGFVSVHLQHHGSDSDLVREEGILALFRSAKDRFHWRDRSLDLNFVIERLAGLASDSSAAGSTHSELAARLDMSRLAAAGHSYGAFSAITLGGFLVDLEEAGGVTDFRNDRVKSLILMSMPKLGDAPEEAWEGVDLPTLHITGTKDRSLLFRTNLEHRTHPFREIEGPHQTLIVLDGATHSTFSDDERRVSRRRADYIRAIGDTTTAFLRATIGGQASAKREMETLQLPGLASVERKGPPL